MTDEYQRGEDVDWIQHSNDELARQLKKRDRKIWFLRFFCTLFFFSSLIMAAILKKISATHSIRELLDF